MTDSRMPSDHHPPIAEKTEQLAVRLPAALLERVDAHREEMQRKAPHGVDVSRSAAIRNLLELALVARGEERAA